MTDGRGDATRRDGEVVRVDLDGFPTTWPEQHRVLPWVWGVYAVIGLVQVVLQLTGETDVRALVVAMVQVALGVVAAVVVRTQRVQLEPAGYRYRDAIFKGRLRPWSSVDQVRPGNARWGTRAEIRGRTASPAPVGLHGMNEEQAEELQRRVAAAQAGAVTAAEESA